MSKKQIAQAARLAADAAQLLATAGGVDEAALANSKTTINTVQIGPATVVTQSLAGGGITPKTGGKLMVSGFISGTGTAGEQVTGTLNLGGTPIAQMVAGIGATSNSWSIAFSAIVDDNGGAGWPVGTPVALTISATAAANLTVAASQACVSAVELPL